MRNNKGITLVALVITIIVLLILAGVSISLVVGENGVLSRATGASEATKLGQLKEAMDLALEDCQTEFFEAYSKDSTVQIGDYVTPERVAASLEKNGYVLLGEGRADDVKADSTVKTDGTSTEWTHEYYVKYKLPEDVLGVEVDLGDNFSVKARYANKMGTVDNDKITIPEAESSSPASGSSGGSEGSGDLGGTGGDSTGTPESGGDS